MKKRTMRTRVLALVLILGASIAASVPPEVSADTPCCRITTIDMKTGILTAKNATTGETFEFRLGNAAQIRNIKIGDQVSPDFQTRMVTVHSFQPVEGILIITPRPPPPIK